MVVPDSVEIGDHLANLPGAGHVDAGGGLVEEQDFGSWMIPAAMVSLRFMPLE